MWTYCLYLANVHPAETFQQKHLQTNQASSFLTLLLASNSWNITDLGISLVMLLSIAPSEWLSHSYREPNLRPSASDLLKVSLPCHSQAKLYVTMPVDLPQSKSLYWSELFYMIADNPFDFTMQHPFVTGEYQDCHPIYQSSVVVSLIFIDSFHFMVVLFDVFCSHSNGYHIFRNHPKVWCQPDHMQKNRKKC